MKETEQYKEKNRSTTPAIKTAAGAQYPQHADRHTITTRALRNGTSKTLKDESRCACRHQCNREDCLNRLASEECNVHNCNIGEHDCGNRLLEGLAHCREWKTEIFTTSNRGKGVRAIGEIPEGKAVTEIKGRAVDLGEWAWELTYSMQKENSRCIDMKGGPGFAEYINHSCNPNCTVERIRHLGETHLVVVAARLIEAGIELTIAYGLQSSTQKCLCGEEACSGIMGRAKSTRADVKHTARKQSSSPIGSGPFNDYGETFWKTYISHEMQV